MNGIYRHTLSTPPRPSLLRVPLCLAFTLFLFLGFSTNSFAQNKILANQVSYKSGNDKMTSLTGCGALGLGPCYDPTVENPNNALVDNNTYATLLASPGVALGLGSYEGVIELQFPQTIPAEQWSYVRIGGDSNLFDDLLGGGLGNALGDVLQVVLIGNQEITIDARMGSTSVLSRSSTQEFSGDRVKMLRTGVGYYLLA